MDREAVVSSNVESIGYDESEQVLEVEFKGGSLYQYKDVPPDVFTALKEADSAGSFLSQNIKNVYECERV